MLRLGARASRGYFVHIYICLLFSFEKYYVNLAGAIDFYFGL